MLNIAVHENITASVSRSAAKLLAGFEASPLIHGARRREGEESLSYLSPFKDASKQQWVTTVLNYQVYLLSAAAPECSDVALRPSERIVHK